MKNSNITLSADSLKTAFDRAAHGLNTYRVFLFFLLIAGLYGFIVWRINVLAVASPTDEDVKTAQQQNQSFKIDESVVQKMLTLKDNSQSVQTLFESARNNPFSE